MAQSFALPTRQGWLLCVGMLAIGLAGCAMQTPQIPSVESSQSLAAQAEAQRSTSRVTPSVPVLKRKIALGRVTNETSYGQSLLRDRMDDPLGKQTADLLSKTLTQSGAYLVFERPDIGRIQAEGVLTATRLDLVGVDSLIVGSLTEFGRKTVGETGFVSSSKRQVAFAKVDLRLVDVKTGLVYFATSGTGEASTETASTFGFGSRASYDGTLNDAAIRQAISDVVQRMTSELSARPWETSILAVEPGRYFISGGKAQGIVAGMLFSVNTPGRRVKSTQTGFDVTLPGSEIARIRVESTFGDAETDQGSIATLASGSLQGHMANELVVRYTGAIQ